jgi:methyl-accepting chemotaxis protein
MAPSVCPTKAASWQCLEPLSLRVGDIVARKFFGLGFFALGREHSQTCDLKAMVAAMHKVQAIIEFNLDGTVICANENFLRAMGYTLDEIKGKHHSVFVEPGYRDSEEYLTFWKRLRSGQFDAGQYKRIGKGGCEVWIQASYNPLLGSDGKPYKVVKFAIDVTAQVLANHALDEASSETLQVVQAVLDGAGDSRVQTAGKSGQIAVLSNAVNRLIDGVLESVVEIQNAVKFALAGDLTKRISLERKTGHFHALAVSVNSLIDNMRNVIQGLQETSREVQLGAEEISRGNADLSQRTEQQASSLEETAASMEQMTATVKNNAESAWQANRLAAAARDQAERGGKVVGSAVVAMGQINDASKKIADIIGVIDEIAFQTNLLALNAAVEAARAGEQGRGFAVVATEVRNLASRSAAAAKEIKALIQDSVAKVNEGTQFVDDSGRVLGEIVTAVKKVTDVVAQIAAGSREQGIGIEQVNQAMASIDTMTQQNSVLVEQATAAAQALSGQATNLAQIIAPYQVGLKPMRAAWMPAPAGRHERAAKKRPWNAVPRAAIAATAPRGQGGSEVASKEQWKDF